MSKDEIIENELNEIPKKIEKLDISTPELMTMINFVTDEHAHIATKNNRQLALFSCIALAIIATLVIVFQMSTLAFIIMDGLLLTVPVILLFIMGRIRNEVT